MILKASQRGGGQDLAVHLMRSDENEHVALHEVRGFISATLKGAFKEAEAVSRATRCRQYLFSLSLSPPEQARVAPDAFEQAIDRVEEQLGLTDQPRAIVFHEKEGRRHAHCVWSRIDGDTLTACPLSFFKRKLVAISRDLYLDHGWDVPRGIDQAGRRDPTNFSLAEWQAAKRRGTDPRLLKETVQQCWARSDDRHSLQAGLQERGLFLSKGDRRSFVVVDHDGGVHALPRALGLKVKEVRARLGDGDDLPSVAETMNTIGQRMTPAVRRHIEEARERFRQRSEQLGRQKADMSERHRAERTALDQRMAAEWQAESCARAARLPTGLRALWQRVTGQYRKTCALNEAEAAAAQTRHAGERQGLIAQHLDERVVLQGEVKRLRRDQATVLRKLRADVGHFLAVTGSKEVTRVQPTPPP